MRSANGNFQKFDSPTGTKHINHNGLSDNFADLKIQLNIQANKVQDWLLANKLSIHYAKKTQFMLFIPRSKAKEKPQDFILEMGGNIIENTPTYKYLGVIIDEKLTWEPQIDQMCKKLSSVCGILSKVRHYLSRNALCL